VPALRRVSLQWVLGVLLLGAAYFGAAKLGQTLRYTASVTAIWPPAGLGIAALYLWGLRWWPGIFLGECLVNADLLLGHAPLPVGSLAGQQLGNMAEVIVGAWLLRRLIGSRATLDRATQVSGLIVAVGIATAISATAGTLSMLAGDVIASSEAPTFWRTWWLGDTTGAVVVLPLVLTWLGNTRAAWRRMRTVEGVLLLASVIPLSIVAVTSSAPLTYLIFPPLIWAAFRFGPPAVTLAVAINAGLTVGITADRVGKFFQQPITDRTLNTQLYVLVSALTALFLSAVVSERERSAAELAQARRREADLARAERLRFARDLHDSVSQALFSSALHTRAAQKALEQIAGGRLYPALRDSLGAIAEVTRNAQREMRRFIFEWGPEGVHNGLVSALAQDVSALMESRDLVVDVQTPTAPLPLSTATQTQLYGIVREALSNVVKHSGAGAASVRLEVNTSRVLMEIVDDGRGFDPTRRRPGHYGLDSMQSRAREIDAALEIRSEPGDGTLVRVHVPVEAEREPDVG
jgi:signal transduction histidine kinase